jgi:ubiquinone/menaquinone biosynthesis C-methylase UbiE
MLVVRQRRYVFGTQQFDCVICTQIFEYLLDPGLAIAEIKRVLRKGGISWSAPSVFLRNNDKECWRFLPEGLRHLLREFETVAATPEGPASMGY